MLTTLLCTTTACEGLLCITHGNAEVENSNVLTSERSLLCDDSINVIKLTKMSSEYVIRTCPHMLQKAKTAKEDQDTQNILK